MQVLTIIFKGHHLIIIITQEIYTVALAKVLLAAPAAGAATAADAAAAPETAAASLLQP